MSEGKVLHLKWHRDSKNPNSEHHSRKAEGHEIAGIPSFEGKDTYIKAARSTRKMVPAILSYKNGFPLIEIHLSSGSVNLSTPSLECFFGRFSDAIRGPNQDEQNEKIRKFRGLYLFRIWAISEVTGRSVGSPFIQKNGESVACSDTLIHFNTMESKLFPDLDEEDCSIYWE